MLRYIVLIGVYVFLALAIKPNPIVLMPGLTGSMLEAKLHHTIAPHNCPVNEDWFKIWIDFEGLYISRFCWFHSMNLKPSKEGYSFEPVGVQVRNPPDSLKAVYCLDPVNVLTCAVTMYMGNMIKHLEKHGHYTYSKNLDAVPYDWRLSPLNHYLPGGLFERLRERIEKMYHEQNLKVTLIAHSMGCAYSALFFNTYVTEDWKNTYIARYISISGVYAGSPKSLKAIVSGDNAGIPYPDKWIQSSQATYGGMHALIPVNTKQKKYWKDSDVLVSIGGKSFNVNQVPEMYKALGMNVNITNTVNKLRSMNFQSPPNVTTHCIYGKGHKTIMSIHLDSATGDARYKPKLSYGDGDGTVPLRSLEVCKGWGKQQHKPVTSKMFSSKHQALMSKDTKVWDYILSIVKGN